LAVAWPEGRTTADEWLASLVLEVGDDDQGSFVRLRLPGTNTTVWGVESIEEPNGVIDSWVTAKAFDLEGDRWAAGDGWREYDGTAGT
jgi:hypothetical protein